MIAYRKLYSKDIDDYYDYLNQLDTETDFMMFEPKERELKVGKEKIAGWLKNANKNGDFLLVATDNRKIIGHISAEKGKVNRTAHSAYIVLGVLKDYRGRGIGTEFFKRLDVWAQENRIVRLELSVATNNDAAIHLYQKNGFEVEGRKVKTMLVKGQYRDEYIMAKIREIF
ncbi:GNAT family N-acetyltransferase [Streptococcus massiliensis]|uniref:Histone acetyltransferase HPA2-like acetyltransferase n=1 Tax=Streptococcus massiliensis TaxID=313439 RepID=A0A380KW43_9STRE|nr:GNAT family protein [Streptococcus massiliensis]SUN75761.1 histone acetyltransferase HPA2-like acetyltransferase [Streptococcus massiliensis]